MVRQRTNGHATTSVAPPVEHLAIPGLELAGATERPPRSLRASFGRMLVDTGTLSAEDVEKAEEDARRGHLSLAGVLSRDGLITDKDLATLLALYLGLPVVELLNEQIDEDALARLPIEIARGYRALPLRQCHGRMTVALADPTDLQAIQDLTARTGCVIDPVVASPQDIQDHIELSYRLIERQAAQSLTSTDAKDGRVTAAVLRNTQPPEVVALLLQQGLQDRASDIHVEPSPSRLQIRFRIDGILHEVMNLPMEMHPAIISRLKIMSGMNIAERRRSQDGQLNFEAGDRTVDVRVAISNTVAGEMAVLRLLDNRKLTLLGLSELGMSGQVLEQYERLLALPHGMIIACGPTGSGKSTTLYASILRIDRAERKVISIEDPIEYHIPKTNQTQVNADVGVTFVTQLRSILRLDPDVILVGEIRDHETAEIATQAALTGHLVLTSLHANDAVSALVRLRDLGVPPYLIVASLTGIVSQRMVRMVCQPCRAYGTPPIAERQAYTSEMGETRTLFAHGPGCNLCAHTGYHGRTGAYELLTMSERIKQLFLADAPTDELRNQALNEGLVPLRRDGMEKVKAEITTPYEVMRVLHSL